MSFTPDDSEPEMILPEQVDPNQPDEKPENMKINCGTASFAPIAIMVPDLSDRKSRVINISLTSIVPKQGWSLKWMDLSIIPPAGRNMILHALNPLRKITSW